MSAHVMLQDPAITGDILNSEVSVAGVGDLSATVAVQEGAGSRVLAGTSALGVAVLFERGAGFAANILAARLAGASTFGAYSLAITTANSISTYAAGGVGATAARFSGKYTYGTEGYPTLLRALAIVSLVSAALGSTALWLGAPFVAHLLSKGSGANAGSIGAGSTGVGSIAALLRFATLSVAGIIAVECARGFFVGQRRLRALLLLSMVVGAGMVTLLPVMAALHSPVRMIVAQGVVTVLAVGTCVVFAGPLQLRMSHSVAQSRLPLRPMLREVWTFGFVQLAGLVGSNVSGWWLTALVARSDASLVQMSFFAIASQLRNLTGLVPSLLTEGSYAVMADPAGEESRTPQRVMAMCTFASTFVALLLASTAIVLLPWGLRLLYGRAYAAATLTAAVGLATAVAHMGNAPTAARLTIVSIRATGIINTVWAVFVAASACTFLFHHGSAAQAMLIFFLGHVLAAGMVLGTLARLDYLPRGMGFLLLVSTAGMGGLLALAAWRAHHPGNDAAATAGMLVLSAAAAGGLLALGKRFRWLPPASVVRQTLHAISTQARRMVRGREVRTTHGA